MRRILDFAVLYPTAHRIQLATNYRCPPAVVEASSRLVATNRERFAKEIRFSRTGADEDASMTAAGTDRPEWADELAGLAGREASAARTICFLARTRSELEPVRLALVHAGVCHHTSAPALIESPPVQRLLGALRKQRPGGHPFHALRAMREGVGWRRGEPGADALADDELHAIDALLGWSVAFRTADAFVAAADVARARLAELMRDDAPVELTTVHGAKGREWETVVIVGWEEDRFPNRRSLLGALDPDRALEEERRLAYVALTRATRRLILAFDPTRPSPFLAEMGFAARA